MTTDRNHIYRIQSFERVAQIFTTAHLYFARPSTWDDPYECLLRHKASDSLFAQCWCKRGVSDAMWRIYSPDKYGLRIRTSIPRLQAELQRRLGERYKVRVEEVLYADASNVRQTVKTIAEELALKFSADRASDALFLKRKAFSHEEEVRVVIYDRQANSKARKSGLSVAIDPHELIENIFVDPRAPQELVDAYKMYFRDKLQFKGTVKRSALYAPGEAVEVA